MLLALILLHMSVMCSPIVASDMDVKAIVGQAEQVARLEKKAVETLVDQTKSQMIVAERQQTERTTGSCPVMGCTALKASANEPKKTSPLLAAQKPLIFVSSSMPIESLKRLAYQAQQHGVLLVIRGMVGGSMHKTAQLVDQIDYPLEIDPKLFERFGIQQVPVFIVPHKGRWHKISGNVELTFALERAYTQRENTP